MDQTFQLVIECMDEWTTDNIRVLLVVARGIISTAVGPLVIQPLPFKFTGNRLPLTISQIEIRYHMFLAISETALLVERLH